MRSIRKSTCGEKDGSKIHMGVLVMVTDLCSSLCKVGVMSISERHFVKAALKLS